MMYDERLLTPMRDELTRLGLEELRTAEAVDAALPNASGTALVVVNSVCGCAARNARPAVALALHHPVRPDRLYTVFAGQDTDATARARGYFTGYRPSSPSIALLRDGRLVHMIERHDIEGRPAEAIARDLVAAFDQHCGEVDSPVPSPTCGRRVKVRTGVPGVPRACGARGCRRAGASPRAGV